MTGLQTVIQIKQLSVGRGPEGTRATLSSAKHSRRTYYSHPGGVAALHPCGVRQQVGPTSRGGHGL